jgi:NCS1 family nucleobase:cation symporter-1
MIEGATIRYPAGRVELRSSEEVHGSRLYNEDLAPVPVAKRHVDHMGLLRPVDLDGPLPPDVHAGVEPDQQGMNWWQALLTILRLAGVDRRRADR